MQDRDLYRGRSLDNNEWVIGWFCKYAFGNWPLKPAAIIPMQEAMDGCFTFVEVDPSTVGQCTGLRDKNGTLIWQGDIVRYPIYGCSNCAHCDDVDECNPSIKIGVVGVCEVNMTNMIYDKRHELISSLYHNSAKCSEVIGSIHTTPELMEGNDGTD